jgi:nitrous oxidase accessory protein NosD
MFRVRYCGVMGLLALMSLCPSEAQPICTLTVQPWQPVQSVVESAPAGAVICLAAGMWTQGISIHNKVLTLWGAGPDQTALMGAAGALSDGISVSGQSVVTVRGLGVYNFRDGIVAFGQSRLSIQDVQLSNNMGSGLWVLGVSDVTLEHALVSYNLDGVVAEDASQVTLQYSQMRENQRDGLRLDFASSGWLVSNIIQGNGRYGIHLYSLENLSVCWRNRVLQNRAGDFYPEAASQRCS